MADGEGCITKAALDTFLCRTEHTTMMTTGIFTVFLLLLPLPVVVEGQEKGSTMAGAKSGGLSSLHERVKEARQNPCRLYLAPSHLSQESSPKYGLFAGVDYDENDVIPDYELAIPLVDFVDGPNANNEYSDIVKYLESAFWTADYAGAKYEGNLSTTLLVPGVGSLAHYHAGVHNIEWLQGSALLRDRETITEPEKFHPSRGAITTYSNMTMRATVHIPMGSELFANFGDVWDESKVDVYEQTIQRWDYKDADLVLDSILNFMDAHGANMDDDLKDDVLDLMLERVLGAAGGKRAKAIRSLIPSNVRKLRQVKEVGGTFNYRNRDMIKSKRWLSKNGICVDTISSGVSEIPEAGRGAFATRPIKKGHRIAVSPMLLVANDDTMNMYEIKKTKTKDDNGDDVTETQYNYDEQIGQQVLVNYAFGHWQSSILLVPLAPGVALMNHAPEEEANAEFDWSFHDKMANDHDLHEKTVDELRELDSPSILLQFTAKRDIDRGEEITISYGAQWENAWEEYKEWYEDFHKEGKWPLRAEDVLENYKDQPFPTDIQTGNIPYPPGVITACYIEADDVPDGTPKVTEEDYDIQMWIGPKTFEDYQGQQLTVCDLASREVDAEHGFVYNVRARLYGNDEIVQINGVPHAAITLKDSPYMGDILAPGSFRRWIGFPDDRFPQKWRNLRE